MIDDYTILKNQTCFVALRKIDINKKGFLVVLDENGMVCGTLTDGDLRRTILAGHHINTVLDEAEAYQRSFIFLRSDQILDDAIDVFKSAKLGFVPIVDANMHLVNILTRKQLHSLLLRCEDVSLAAYDFLSVSENLMDFEIFNRPWGIYKTTVLQDHYQSKVLQIKPGGSLSLQYHLHREEYWTVAHGVGMVYIEGSKKPVVQGSTIFIPRGSKHRLENTSETEHLVVSEVQIGDYFGEDDIVRVEDNYGRECAGGKMES